MRYRRLSYRYAVVLAAGERRPITDARRFDQPGVRVAETVWRPPADVYETADSIQITVELPGVDQEALDALLFEDAVIIEGERQLPAAGERGVYHAAEIRRGAFRLEVALPARVDPERVVARYERGMLEMQFIKQPMTTKPGVRRVAARRGGR